MMYDYFTGKMKTLADFDKSHEVCYPEKFQILVDSVINSRGGYYDKEAFEIKMAWRDVSYYNSAPHIVASYKGYMLLRFWQTGCYWIRRYKSSSHNGPKAYENWSSDDSVWWGSRSQLERIFELGVKANVKSLTVSEVLDLIGASKEPGFNRRQFLNSLPNGENSMIPQEDLWKIRRSGDILFYFLNRI